MSASRCRGCGVECFLELWNLNDDYSCSMFVLACGERLCELGSTVRTSERIVVTSRAERKSHFLKQSQLAEIPSATVRSRLESKRAPQCIEGMSLVQNSCRN